MTGSTINPDRVLKELGELWADLGKEGDSEQGVLRACAMTLVVFTDPKEDPNDAGENIAALMRDHPSRAIVVRLSAGAELRARVFAQCWMPFGSRRQICCEQVEITGSPDAIEDVGAAIVPLLAPDLPVIFWVRDASLLPKFGKWAEVASKIVVHSTRAADPAGVLRQILQQKNTVADLTWARLTRWRELIAQVFENPVYLAKLGEIDAVRIGYVTDQIPVSGHYLAAWLQLGLNAAGARPRVEFTRPEPVGEGSIQSLELSSADGFRYILEKVDPSIVEVRLEGVVNRAIFRQPSDCELLAEELSISGHDPVFERVLAHLRKTLA
jgi:hypothetical protein